MIINVIGDTNGTATKIEANGIRLRITTRESIRLEAYSLHRIQVTHNKMRVSFMAIYIGLEWPTMEDTVYIFEIKPDMELFFNSYVKLVLDNTNKRQ